MCFHQKRACACGSEEAYIFHRDSVLPEEVLVEIYCPRCRDRAHWDEASMIEDGGWILAYDMEAARFYLGQRGYVGAVTANVIFDEDWCSWYGLSPTDMAQNTKLHEELEPLRRKDLAAYIEEIRRRRLEQLETLKREGWRKAARG